jgi:hypothetical protein
VLASWQVDQGAFLRGNNLTFTVRWNIIPYAGLLSDEGWAADNGTYTLPDAYRSAKKYEPR